MSHSNRYDRMGVVYSPLLKTLVRAEVNILHSAVYTYYLYCPLIILYQFRSRFYKKDILKYF